MSKRFPNLFLAGAPKCGTTSLYDWLARHPAIFAPELKEPVYFGSDLTARARREKADYLSHYEGWDNEPFALDGSTHYFYSATAAEEIAKASPGARAIVCLRDPASAVHSMYHQLRFNGAETAVDFASALDAEVERAGKLEPMRRGFPENRLYSRVYAYRRNIERLRKALGREKVRIVLLDDLKANPMEELEALFDWFGIDTLPAGTIDTVARNGAKRPRSRKLHDLAAYPPPWLALFSKPLASPSLRARVRQTLKRWNTAPDTNPELDSELRARLCRRHSGDIAWLEDELDRDLGHWRR